MAVATRDDSGRASRHEDEVKSLTAQISFLDEEIAVLRRRLSEPQRQVRMLEDRLHETESSLVGVTAQNERLAATLREARDQIVALMTALRDDPACRFEQMMDLAGVDWPERERRFDVVYNLSLIHL
mgnify:CR=1 FL=1